MTVPTSKYHALALYLFGTLDPLIRFLFLPWGVYYVELCIPGSWAKDSSFYGLLYSALLLGRIIGSNYDLFYQKHSSFNLILLIPFVSNQISAILICYFLMIISNRFIISVFLFLSIGIISGRISNLICMKKNNLSVPKPTTQNNFLNFNMDPANKLSSFEIDQESYDKLNSFILIFTSLYSGVMYNKSPDAKYPLLFPFLMVLVLCIIVFVFFYFAKYSGKKQLSISKSAGLSIFPEKSGIMTKLDHIELPPRPFIEVCKGNVSKAIETYKKAHAWRTHNSIDDIFRRAQYEFDNILKFYPHAIHGVALDGSHVVYEVIGKSNPRELSNLGIGPEKLVMHFVLRNEFIFHRFHKSRSHLPFNPDSDSMVSSDELNKEYHNEECVKLMTILDVKDIKITDITTDVISFIKQSSDIVDNYYPGRVVRLIVVNAPTWFWSVWSMISRVLPDSVKKKIVIMNDTAGLENYISSGQRSRAYGGNGPDLGQSPEHLEFLSIAEHWAKNYSSLKSNSSPDLSALKGKNIM